jgi:membrane dipeptidase
MPFLAIGRQVTADDVIAHIEHAIDVCGEDQVGVGTDGGFTPVDDMAAYRAILVKVIEDRRAAGISAPGESPDIFPFVQELQGPDQFRELGRRLKLRGHKQARIDKILGGNFLSSAGGVRGG